MTHKEMKFNSECTIDFLDHAQTVDLLFFILPSKWKALVLEQEYCSCSGKLQGPFNTWSLRIPTSEPNFKEY